MATKKLNTIHNEIEASLRAAIELAKLVPPDDVGDDTRLLETGLDSLRDGLQLAEIEFDGQFADDLRLLDTGLDSLGLVM